MRKARVLMRVVCRIASDLPTRASMSWIGGRRVCEQLGHDLDWSDVLREWDEFVEALEDCDWTSRSLASVQEEVDDTAYMFLGFLYSRYKFDLPAVLGLISFMKIEGRFVLFKSIFEENHLPWSVKYTARGSNWHKDEKVEWALDAAWASRDPLLCPPAYSPESRELLEEVGLVETYARVFDAFRSFQRTSSAYWKLRYVDGSVSAPQLGRVEPILARAALMQHAKGALPVIGIEEHDWRIHE